MKLNLRDLFWLIFVVAIFGAWFVSHRRQQAEVRRAEEDVMSMVEENLRQQVEDRKRRQDAQKTIETLTRHIQSEAIEIAKRRLADQSKSSDESSED